MKDLESRMMNHADLLHQENIGLVIEKQEYNLFVLLKPKFGIDGNQYYVLLGEDLQCGVAGFGDTLYLAICDFNKSFHKEITRTRREGLIIASREHRTAQGLFRTYHHQGF